MKNQDKTVQETVKVEEKPVEKKVEAPETKPFTIMSQEDAYIAERMKSQPKSLEDIRVELTEQKDFHRLSLPEYFEQFSYDCTWESKPACKVHRWGAHEKVLGRNKSIQVWEQGFHGEYVFRWLNKKVQALDHAINVRGWLLVNSNYFPEAPNLLFTVNGGVQNGDSILAFMPVKRAIQIREKPSKDSRFRINSEESKYEGHPKFYKAKLSPTEEATSEETASSEDAWQEGRDFDEKGNLLRR